MKSRAEKKAAVQSLNAARTSSVPFGSDLMGAREMSVSGNSFNMQNNFNTGYQMFQGAGGFGIDVKSDNPNQLKNSGLTNLEHGTIDLNSSMPMQGTHIFVGPIMSNKSGTSSKPRGGIKAILANAIERQIDNEVDLKE